MSWIWLDNRKYRDKQFTKGSSFNNKSLNYCVVSFSKEFCFDKEIASIRLKFAADTSGYLKLDDTIVFNDNAKTNGDFSIKEGTINDIYFLEDLIEIKEPKKNFIISSFVQLGVTRLYDFSSGHGGLYIEGEIIFKDGSKTMIETDSTWVARLEKSYPNPEEFDNTIEQEQPFNAALVKGNWKLINPQINKPIEKEIAFNNIFVFKPHSKKKYHVDLPKSYAAHYEIEVIGNSLLEAALTSTEIKGALSHVNKFKTNKSQRFRFFDLLSCGGFILDAVNKGDKEVKVIVHIYHSYYPFKKVNQIITNNKKLNDLFEKCAFAVQNCSQSILLDSPKHCEPSASCSGDYNIISLTNAFLTGDYSLAKHTLREYARLMEITGGVNANSSYALIFIKWLKNIYMFTGDKELIQDCQNGVRCALELFLSFIGESGLVEKSYNYIFIDWLTVDGFDLFAPPKNLGQSVVSMNLYDALLCSSYLFSELGNYRLSNRYKRAGNKLKKAINDKLFNKALSLYSEGLNTPDEEQPLRVNKPDVTDVIYYRKHANILAVSSGITSKVNSKRIINKIFKDPLICNLPVQPYFDHYLFEAIHKADLDKKYAFRLLKEFTTYIKIKDKGLPEGFFKPHPGYVFDYSHAWACTPYYSFIMATSGLEILEPKFKTIRIKPLICKLDYSYIIPTLYGDIKVIKRGNDFSFNAPKEITVLK